jgi:lysophospholipase L1-like esterase
VSLPTTASAREAAINRAAPAPTLATPGEFSELVVLGDSLSDSGNAGRFCDGPVWVELLADNLELEARPSRLGGTNFAVGGAHIAGGEHDLSHQLDSLLERRRGRLDPEALFVVYAGGNDLLAGMASVQLFHAAERAAAALDGILDRMLEAGARRFLVANLPDLGLTPAVVAIALPLSKLARRLTRAFNARLADIVSARNAKGGVRVVLGLRPQREGRCTGRSRRRVRRGATDDERPVRGNEPAVLRSHASGGVGASAPRRGGRGGRCRPATRSFHKRLTKGKDLNFQWVAKREGRNSGAGHRLHGRIALTLPPQFRRTPP